MRQSSSHHQLTADQVPRARGRDWNKLPSPPPVHDTEQYLDVPDYQCWTSVRDARRAISCDRILPLGLQLPEVVGLLGLWKATSAKPILGRVSVPRLWLLNRI